MLTTKAYAGNGDRGYVDRKLRLRKMHNRSDDELQEEYASRGETYDPEVKRSVRSLIRNVNPLAGLPIRAALNAPEAYGGVRVTDITGAGTVVCHPDQVESVREADRRMKCHFVCDILRDALGDKEASKYDTAHMSAWEAQKFLEQYGQPLAPSSPAKLMPMDHYQLYYCKHDKSTDFSETGKRTPVWTDDMDVEHEEILAVRDYEAIKLCEKQRKDEPVDPRMCFLSDDDDLDLLLGESEQTTPVSTESEENWSVEDLLEQTLML